MVLINSKHPPAPPLSVLEVPLHPTQHQRRALPHLSSSSNEISCACKFMDGAFTMIDIQHYDLCSKLDDGSASLMRCHHLISNTKCTIKMMMRSPSMKMRYHKNTLGELIKWSETPPCTTNLGTRNHHNQLTQSSGHSATNRGNRR